MFINKRSFTNLSALFQKKKEAPTENIKSLFKGQDKTELREAIEWLTDRYPKCFNPQNPKPLNIGIKKDIILKGEWPYPRDFLQRTLSFYVKSPFYQQALLNEQKRYSLEGDSIGEVSDDQKEDARAILKALKIN